MGLFINEFLEAHWQRRRRQHADAGGERASTAVTRMLATDRWQSALTVTAVGLAVGLVLAMLWLSDQWYRGLSLPQWALPQAWLMSAWTVLAICCAIAVLAIHRLRGVDATALNRPLLLLNLQLLLGLAWLGLFYGLHALGAAFSLACVLWLLTLATVAAFMNLRPLAAWLLVPQMLWFSYLLILNGVLWLTAASPSWGID